MIIVISDQKVFFNALKYLAVSLPFSLFLFILSITYTQIGYRLQTGHNIIKMFFGINCVNILTDNVSLKQLIDVFMMTSQFK